MRHLYLWFALAFAVMVFSFWPTTVGPYGPPDPLRIVHGVFAATWMAMLVVQSWLAGRARFKIHRWVGRASMVVAPGVVITALWVLIDSLPTGGAARFPRPLLLMTTWIDLWSLALFSALYVSAVIKRRDMFVHARLMASTVFVALIPALGRAYGMNIPALGGLAGAFNLSFWTCEAILLGLALRDGFRGRWLSPFWLTLIALEAIRLTVFAAPDWPIFIAFAESLGLPR